MNYRDEYLYLTCVSALRGFRGKAAERIIIKAFTSLKGDERANMFYALEGLSTPVADKLMLDIAVDQGVIAEGYSVTVPDYRDQDPTERSARNYPGITFSATYVGAINTVEIDGVVSP